jgi:anti-anti-sigma regulatory factor
MAELSVEVKQSDGWIVFHLKGPINEKSQLPELAEIRGAGVVVDAAGVDRINSLGVATWIRFFAYLNKNAARVVVRRLPPVLVLQTSMISNFLGPATVESILIPWACERCDEGSEQLQIMSDPIPDSVPCPRCGSPMELDDEPDAYFAFSRSA